MKAILSYGNYFNHGKQYQIKFIYDFIEEAILISNYIQNYNYNNEFKTSITTFNDHQHNQNVDIIDKTNIPKDSLLQIINELITQCNAKVIIGNQTFISFNQEAIENAINKLHINITLKRGKYFNLKDCYFATFKYFSDEQRSQVSYDFNINLNPLIGRNVDNNEDSYIYPFVVDRNGHITSENTDIIGGTNIPNHTLAFFLTRFINEYNAIITIDNKQFKDTIDSTKLLESLSNLEKAKTRIRRQK